MGIVYGGYNTVGETLRLTSRASNRFLILTIKARIVQYCRIYSIGMIREFRAAIVRETD